MLSQDPSQAVSGWLAIHHSFLLLQHTWHWVHCLPSSKSSLGRLPVPLAFRGAAAQPVHPPFPWLPLQISYEASTEMLSLKRLYPSFLRTIPSDRQQVKAIFLLLQHFGWTWVALLGSNNAYGRAGLDALQELLSASNVCVAYRGTIPANSDTSNPELHNLVRILTDVKVNVTIVFSNRASTLPFFEVVVQRNITGMVWVASEDWSLAQTIWQVPGIQTIGSVIGMAVEKPESMMLERFEAWRMSEEGTVAECASSAEAGRESVGSTRLDCTQCCTSCRALAAVPDMYDTQGSFNVYSAVYAVAHGLHDLLGCASGACSKGTVYPWQVRATLWKKIHEDPFPQGRIFPLCLEVSCPSQRLKSQLKTPVGFSCPSKSEQPRPRPRLHPRSLVPLPPTPHWMGFPADVGGLESGCSIEAGSSSTSPSQWQKSCHWKGSSLTLLFYSSYKRLGK